MKIIVCIKQVPDTASVKLDPETHTLKREGVESIINPFDLFALEAGLRLREELGGELHVLSMGPPQAAEVIKEAIGYGVNGGLLLTDRAFAGADTWATTAALAAGVKHLGGADLIICGRPWTATPPRWVRAWLCAWAFPMWPLSRLSRR